MALPCARWIHQDRAHRPLSFFFIRRSSRLSVVRSSCDGTMLSLEKSFVLSPNLSTSGSTSGVHLQEDRKRDMQRERERETRGGELEEEMTSAVSSSRFRIAAQLQKGYLRHRVHEEL